MKKILAILLSLVLSITLFVSCKKDETQNPSDTSKDQSTTTTTASGINGYDWLYSDDEVMFTVGDEKVTFEDFRYYAMYNKYYFDYGDESYWTDITNEDYKQLIVEEFTVLLAMKSLCNNELGIFYDEEDAALLEANLKAMKEYYGDETFAEYLDSMYISEEQFRRLSEFDYLREKLYKSYVSDEEIAEYANENYVRAQHILVKTVDENYAELPEAEIAAKKALAEEIYQKAVSGEDFSSLIAEYGEDPGMETYPEGYIFTYNQMYEEFEDATFALQVGAISEPVKTKVGYHIIKKLPLDTEYFLDRANAEYLDILYILGPERANDAINEHIETLEVVETDKLKELTMQNIGTPKE